VEQYRAIIRDVVCKTAAFCKSTDDIQTEVILDDAGGHYELRRVGWDGWIRVHDSLLHIDIKDGKIVIQHDGFEDAAADQLMEAGVPAEQILLAFHHPYKRKYTPFAQS
jgi:hypothetical protein